MRKYTLAVAVKETEYLRRLADYVRDSPLAEQWQVTGFTNAEACKQYAMQGYKIDLLAAQPELLGELRELRERWPAIPAVALVMGLGDSGEEHELHQYQPLPLLLQRLEEVHARLAGQPPRLVPGGDEPDGVRILTVYSASGSTGKTALALHLAHAASSHGRRAFYLNLERWNTADAWLGVPRSAAAASGGEGLSELLYGLKAQPGQAAEWLLEHRIRHPLLKADYLAACTNVEDRLTLGPEDAAGILDAIARSGQYDLIVVDLDDGLDELHASVFDRSDRVLWLTSGNLSVLGKQRMALHYGERKWGERFASAMSKALFVHNRAVNAAGLTPDETHALPYAPVQLPEVPEWRDPGAATLLSSPSFRAASDKLYKHLFHEGGESDANGFGRARAAE
ncbi:P-loop NTPase family protein [Paenibacillus arenilitoris]|uniref:CobQ/CobB/MinD/ParA nucleotide binding domain-containing protein n=1 Tax=Paenibacillus arenilitoris TaxID=2772299 RepID=A0A927CGQ3_9BACL|nr:hypothetical protein [Paenibacillus arenilitoris]MBD2867778.1 hypothetical protein [Paenibacillus arenilitoris]